MSADVHFKVRLLLRFSLCGDCAVPPLARLLAQPARAAVVHLQPPPRALSRRSAVTSKKAARRAAA
jgi:hypothetical protein